MAHSYIQRFMIEEWNELRIKNDETRKQYLKNIIYA